MTPLIVGAGSSQHHYCVITEKERKKERERKRQLFLTDAQTHFLAHVPNLRSCGAGQRITEVKSTLFKGSFKGLKMALIQNMTLVHTMIRNYRGVKTRKHIACAMTHLTVHLRWVSEHFTKNSQESCHIMVYICQHEKILIWLSCPPLYTKNWSLQLFFTCSCSISENLVSLHQCSVISITISLIRFCRNHCVSLKNDCYNLSHMKCTSYRGLTPRCYSCATFKRIT